MNVKEIWNKVLLMNLFFGYIMIMLRSETLVYKYIPMPQAQLSRLTVASTTN